VEGLADLLENTPAGRAICIGSALVWCAAIAFYEFGPGIAERGHSWRADYLRNNYGKRRPEMPAVVIPIFVALLTVLEGTAIYLGIKGELMFPLLIFTLVLVVFGVSQTHQWLTGTGDHAPSTHYAASAYQPAHLQQAAPTTKKKSKKRKVAVCPLPAAEPPRRGRRVRWFDGPLSRVRGEYYTDDDCSDRVLVKMLRRHGLIVLTSAEAGNKGAADEYHLWFATRRRMVVITRDFGFERMHEAGAKHSGIIHAPHGPVYYAEILRVALRMAGEVAEK
jgi:Domain of unknown function (DUF5615)